MIFSSQIPLPGEDDTKDVKSILTYLVVALILGCGFVIRYLILQNTQRFKDKDAVIASKDNEILELKKDLKEEVEYSKSQGISTVKMISDNNSVLRTLNKSFETLDIDIGNHIKPIVKNNNDLAKEIKAHILDKSSND